ncbi:MAG: hypothetical protein JF615_07495 [Asticcacaulis sp.]|nr:hypothetical protein [Asticcacaulis sp.]
MLLHIAVADALGIAFEFVAALAAGIASCGPRIYKDDLDPALYEMLDHGRGRAWLEPLDAALRAMP